MGVSRCIECFDAFPDVAENTPPSTAIFALAYAAESHGASDANLTVPPRKNSTGTISETEWDLNSQT